MKNLERLEEKGHSAEKQCTKEHTTVERRGRIGARGRDHYLLNIVTGGILRSFYLKNFIIALLHLGGRRISRCSVTLILGLCVSHAINKPKI
jgi:hypothetical protein